MSRASEARSSEAQPETLDIWAAHYPFVFRSDMTGCLPARTGVWGQRPQDLNLLLAPNSCHNNMLLVFGNLRIDAVFRCCIPQYTLW